MLQTFWTSFIRCVNMKWIWLALLKIGGRDDSVHRRTDRWTDRLTDGQGEASIPPFQLCGSGVIKIINIYKKEEISIQYSTKHYNEFFNFLCIFNFLYIQLHTLNISFELNTHRSSQTVLHFQHHICWCPRPRLNINTVFPRYGDSHVKDRTVVPGITRAYETSCVVYGTASNTNLRQLDSIRNWIETGIGSILHQPSVQPIHRGQRSSFGGTSIKAVHALLCENSCLHWQSSTSCLAWIRPDH